MSGAGSDRPTGAAAHQAAVRDQFTRQAADFASAPSLHAEAPLALMVEAAAPRPDDEALDVACGPGTVVAALAPHVRLAVGLDATDAMLEQARALAEARGLRNVAWYRGDAYALPFAADSFAIVTCRFTFHHLEKPNRAFAEMVRVCRPGGRVVLCDVVASDDPAKAAAFNRMERHRDPSTVESRPLAELLGLYAATGLPAPAQRRFRLPQERDALIARSYPAGGDRDALRRMIDEAVDGDRMGLQARREGGSVVFALPAVVLTAVKPARLLPR